MDNKLGKVLVVDDDKNISEIIGIYLMNAGYEIKKVYNGKQALSVYEEIKPDLVLLDIMLPGMDGVEVLKGIRKNNSTPVIMLTAKGDTFDKVLALELGAEGAPFICVFMADLPSKADLVIFLG